MIAPASPRPTDQAGDDIAAGIVTFRVAADAEPGDVLPALAALLIGMDRTRKEREQAGTLDQGDQENPQP
jgi:hypothetical protein